MPKSTDASAKKPRKPYERFTAWAACHELTIAVYRISESWPRHELYGLISQSRRAAVSSAANIAEGAAKRGNREFRRFLDISLGSLNELSYLLLLARDLGYAPIEHYGEVEALRDHANRLTWGLHSSIVKKIASEQRGAKSSGA